MSPCTECGHCCSFVLRQLLITFICVSGDSSTHTPSQWPHVTLNLMGTGFLGQTSESTCCVQENASDPALQPLLVHEHVVCRAAPRLHWSLGKTLVLQSRKLSPAVCQLRTLSRTVRQVRNLCVLSQHLVVVVLGSQISS